MVAAARPRRQAKSGLTLRRAVADVLELPARHRRDVGPAVAELPDHRRLEARVHLAVVAARVLPALPVVPVDAAEELAPVAVVLALDQVAGSLPPLRGVRRVAPRRARVVAEPRREL